VIPSYSQTMTFQEDTKRRQGFTDPLDKSPFENPEGWYHGSVGNTGGNIMCRIWRTEKDTTETTDTYYECAYNTDNKIVSLTMYEWNEDKGYHDFGGTISEIKADSRKDTDLAKAAKELMELFNSSQSVENMPDTINF